MNDDLEIRELIHSCRPELGDSAEFMESLDAKLEAVEEIKAYHDCQIRKCRTMTMLALVIGGVFGALFVAILLIKPTSSPQFALLLDSSFYVFLMTYKMPILVATGLALAVVGLLPILKPTR